MTVTIVFKDGTTRHWPEQHRAGGSWTNSVRYEGGFVIVKDPWHSTSAFPAEDVKEVNTDPRQRG